MRIAVMGTGGVGGYFGARLAAGGHDVAFIARGAQLEALRAKGLRVESPLGDLHLAEIVATDDPAELEPVDLVLFGVKLWDTEHAAEQIRPLLRPGTAVVSFQNGVVKDDILRRVLGPEHVLGGVCYIAATIAEPGVIKHANTLQRLVFGEYDGMPSARVEAFRNACADSGIDVEVSPDIERTIWEKFVFLVGLSGTTSLARTPIGPIRANPRSRAFLHDVMDEVVQVARAAGVELPADYAEDRMAFVDTVAETMTSSMHHDLERGNRLEVPWLSGDVVDRARALGVPAPANRAIADMLSVHAEGAQSAPIASHALRTPSP
ncbi:ketopantoate reductase family protein [Kutzneria kofuensis]|uniref:2-dehydropantoate 2-reductase n=1 Tax=Kutzneria kofuensis TaxID=103725 RepID=A0A7W9KN22_9PSEU|nr:2-dehydropantoate 2-reductase [Kutzneria kofuensis]MBB5894844.1 2-dehydropantoate 2-reductase [Kutzneria kofuensis]